MQPASQEVAEEGTAADGTELLVTNERILALAVPHTEVQMAAAACGVCEGLGHECDAHSQLIAHFFEALLVHGVSVRHGQYVCIPYIEFVLTEATLAFAVLDRYTTRFQMTTELARILLLSRRL